MAEKMKKENGKSPRCHTHRGLFIDFVTRMKQILYFCEKFYSYETKKLYLEYVRSAKILFPLDKYVDALAKEQKLF